jgi:hypothetical protein
MGRNKIPGRDGSRRREETSLDLALDINNAVGLSLGLLKERAGFAG